MFWKLILAHLLTDFVLQPDWMCKGKVKGIILAVHGGIFFALCLFFINTSLTGVMTTGLLVLACLHSLIDFAKLGLQKRTQKWDALLFIFDQCLHVATIVLFVLLFRPAEMQFLIQQVAGSVLQHNLALVLSFLILIVWGGGYFTAAICRGYIPKIDGTENKGIPNAGKYIGMLERTLILIAVLVGKFEIIGFLLAAKSIIRHPEMKGDPQFTEYFLIGTLTSVSWAVVGSLFFMKIVELCSR